jgi:hypothetical protein
MKPGLKSRLLHIFFAVAAIAYSGVGIYLWREAKVCRGRTSDGLTITRKTPRSETRRSQKSASRSSGSCSKTGAYRPPRRRMQKQRNQLHSNVLAVVLQIFDDGAFALSPGDEVVDGRRVDQIGSPEALQSGRIILFARRYPFSSTVTKRSIFITYLPGFAVRSTVWMTSLYWPVVNAVRSIGSGPSVPFGLSTVRINFPSGPTSSMTRSTPCWSASPRTAAPSSSETV